MTNPIAISLVMLMSVAGASLAQSTDPKGPQVGAPETGARYMVSSESLSTLIHRDVWVGYRVPIVEDAGSVCCFDGDRGIGCRLEGGNRYSHGMRGEFETDGGKKHVPEKHIPGTELVVFIRPASAADGNHQRRRVHAYDSACPIQADGLEIHWLGDIPVEDSLALLAPWAFGADASRHDHEQSALWAIAQHAGKQATKRLADAARDDTHADKLRADVAFWLGVARGEDGYDVLRELFDTVDRPSLRKRLVIALAQSPVPEALEQLVDLARSDRSGDVRGDALFWLAQTASARVPRVLLDAAERDPDVEVKKKAVFALGQLPADRGVPLLIDVAQQHASAAVREHAIFWLGQSEDPRALDFIVSLLTPERLET